MSPDASPRSRKRAVRLTDEALARLRAGLHAKWQADAPGQRLTRELRAELLGVSQATADRVLRGEGVDKATLSVAFGRVGLALNPADYGTDRLPEIPRAALDPDSPPPSLPKSSVRGRHLVLLGAVLLLVALLSAFRVGTASKEAWPPVWRLALDRDLARGTEAFRRGDYRLARTWAERAMAIARDRESAGRMAEALRLSGDVAAATGDLARSRRDYGRSFQIRQTLAQSETLPPLHEAMGEVERRMGRYAEARSHLDIALGYYRRERNSLGMALAYRDLGQLDYDEGKWRSSSTSYERSLALLTHKPEPGLAVDVKARLALVMLKDTKKIDEARSMLASCLVYWSRKGHPRWVATMRLRMGQLELEAGNKGLAYQYLGQSRTGFERVGDRSGAREASRNLMALR